MSDKKLRLERFIKKSVINQSSYRKVGIDLEREHKPLHLGDLSTKTQLQDYVYYKVCVGCEGTPVLNEEEFQLVTSRLKALDIL
jgi:hypothetical protein